MAMKRYTPDELAEVLRLHKLWRQSQEGGIRAYLSRAYLCDANLCDANLSGANLSGANLSRAYLSRADLSRAYLCDANLGGANLSGADLSRADLSRAYLCDANLCDANLSGAYLSGAKGKFAIATMRVYSGLYDYQCWAVVAKDGTPWIRMGCLFKPLPQWIAEGGIRPSNTSEFPDDGSVKSERRARAFAYVCGEVEALLEQAKADGLIEPR
jgi:hypothetical protein